MPTIVVVFLIAFRQVIFVILLILEGTFYYSSNIFSIEKLFAFYFKGAAGCYNKNEAAFMSKESFTTKESFAKYRAITIIKRVI